MGLDLGVITTRVVAVNRYRYRTLRSIAGWTLVIAIGAILIGFASKNADRFTCEPDPHTVEYGDTLWAIAVVKCDGNIQSVTQNLVDTYGANIQLGDTIWLPINQDCLLENRDGQIWDTCD